MYSLSNIFTCPKCGQVFHIHILLDINDVDGLCHDCLGEKEMEEQQEEQQEEVV